MPINIGAHAFDRAFASSYQITYIAVDRPSPYDGLITHIAIWAHRTLLDVTVGSFSRNGDSFTSRDSYHLINVLSGRYQTYADINIIVHRGDHIGIHFTAGEIDLDTSGGAGVYYRELNQFGAGEQTYTYIPGWVMSLGGVVTLVPPATIDWWTLTNTWIDLFPSAILIHADTNTTQHLFITWSFYKPSRVPIWRMRRGKRIMCGYTYHWINPTIVEQNEPGNTINHTFGVSGLRPASTLWFYIWNTFGPTNRECQGPLMSVTVLPPLNIGAEAIDRVTVLSVQSTLIQAGNPASQDGQLVAVEIWAHFTITDCKVGTFTPSGDGFICRDYTLIGTVVEGEKRTFSGLAIDAQVGDHIGIYGTAGHIDVDMVGGDGIYYAIGDHFDGEPFSVHYQPNFIASLAGYITNS